MTDPESCIASNVNPLVLIIIQDSKYSVQVIEQGSWTFSFHVCVRMIPLQTSMIWAVYVIVVAVLFVVASVFIYAYQTPRDRSTSVTLTCIIAIACLLATVLLLPVDVALTSSTVSSLGRRQNWATQDVVDNITISLTLAYYILYSVDILLCFLVVPFTYFWYEEYDEVGEQSTGQRLWGATKYTLSFIILLIALFLVGFFAPISSLDDSNGLHYLEKPLGRNRKVSHYAPVMLLTLTAIYF